MSRVRLPALLGVLASMGACAKSAPSWSSDPAPLAAPGRGIISNIARKSGNGSVGLVLADESTGRLVALTNFHVVYRQALQSIACPMLRGQMVRGSDAINAYSVVDESKMLKKGPMLGRRFRQAYFDSISFGVCIRAIRKKNRGADAATFELETGRGWSNRVVGCPRMEITKIGHLEAGKIVAKSGRRTGITFGKVSKEKDCCSKICNVKISTLSDEEYAAEKSRGVIRPNHPREEGCPESAISCPGDSGSVWFEWPSQDEIHSSSQTIEVTAVALHHKGGPTVTPLTDIVELFAERGLRLRPPTTPGSEHVALPGDEARYSGSPSVCRVSTAQAKVKIDD